MGVYVISDVYNVSSTEDGDVYLDGEENNYNGGRQRNDIENNGMKFCKVQSGFEPASDNLTSTSSLRDASSNNRFEVTSDSLGSETEQHFSSNSIKKEMFKKIRTQSMDEHEVKPGFKKLTGPLKNNRGLNRLRSTFITNINQNEKKTLFKIKEMQEEESSYSRRSKDSSVSLLKDSNLDEELGARIEERDGQDNKVNVKENVDEELKKDSWMNMHPCIASNLENEQKATSISESH